MYLCKKMSPFEILNLGFTKGIEPDGAPDRVNLPFLFDVFSGKFGLDLDMTGV